MVAGISGGIASYTSLFSLFSNTNTQSAGEKSFENIINDAQNTVDLVCADDIASTGENDVNDKSSNAMDLNKDGTITIDEIMKYMELQMQENMKESLETSEMEGEHNSNNSFLHNFKTPINQVIKAYSAFK